MIRTCSLVCVYTLIASAITIGSSFAQCQVQNVSQPNYAVRPRYSFSCAAPCTSWDVYVLDYPAAATRGCRLPCHVSTNISGTGSVQPMGSELQMNFNGSALTLSTVLGKIRIVAQCVYEQNSLPSTYREGLMLRVDYRGVTTSTPKPYACGSRQTPLSISPSPNSVSER